MGVAGVDTGLVESIPASLPRHPARVAVGFRWTGLPPWACP
jgi:hypothetical protein